MASSLIIKLKRRGIYMVTVKLGKLREIIEGLNEILSKELPVRPAYWFGKLAKKIQKEFVEFEDNRMVLVKKYALRDENMEFIVEDNKYKFADIEAFNIGYKELSDTETEIDFNQITLEQLGDIKISPAVMIWLDKFIGDEPEKAETKE